MIKALKSLIYNYKLLFVFFLIIFQSISRQHAVINILNNRDFMLMDLDSANKTKLADVSNNCLINFPFFDKSMVI